MFSKFFNEEKFRTALNEMVSAEVARLAALEPVTVKQPEILEVGDVVTFKMFSEIGVRGVITKVSACGPFLYWFRKDGATTENRNWSRSAFEFVSRPVKNEPVEPKELEVGDVVIMTTRHGKANGVITGVPEYLGLPYSFKGDLTGMELHGYMRSAFTFVERPAKVEATACTRHVLKVGDVAVDVAVHGGDGKVWRATGHNLTGEFAVKFSPETPVERRKIDAVLWDAKVSDLPPGGLALPCSYTGYVEADKNERCEDGTRVIVRDVIGRYKNVIWTADGFCYLIASGETRTSIFKEERA